MFCEEGFLSDDELKLIKQYESRVQSVGNNMYSLSVGPCFIYSISKIEP